MQKRTCKECGLSKSVTAFRTPRGRKCTDCLDAGDKARSKRYYQNNCEDIKASVNQRRLDNLELDRDRKRREYQNNSEYIKARSQRNRDNNPENIKAMSKRYYKENREQIISRTYLYYWGSTENAKAGISQYYTEHRVEISQRSSQYYQVNQVSLKEYWSNYRKKFPEKCRSHEHKRRTRKTQAGGFFTGEEWLALKEQYGYSCLGCFKKEPEIKLTADHIVPVSKGGTSNIDNIQPLCKSCNCKKHNKVIDYRTAWEGELRA